MLSVPGGKMKFRNVLLLDSSMMPIRTIGWQRAMLLWFQGKARIIEDQDAEVHGATWRYKIPSVIQLTDYVMKNWDKHIRFSRRNVFHRDAYTCQYCNQRPAPHRLTLEHVLPRCRGGQTNWINIVTACFACNQKKEGKTPEEAGMRLRKKPAKPQGRDYFKFALPEEIPQIWKPYLYFL